MRLLLTAALLAGFATGCYATTGTGYYGGTVTATTVAPDLVYVSPGVQVIADYDEPVFYADGFYWRESGGTWYRSSYHTHGWAYAAPPRTVISIQNRHGYSHYRPAGYVRRDHRYQQSRPAYRDNRNYRDNRSRPVVRDNRNYNRPAARPAARDNRDHRDRKRDDRDHRR
ncbi:MAG: hypothetical protein ABI867_31570 [Kofleriaceae bacterium]